ncbi:hypothetical protein AHMF7605_03390 [Adhaeribacter arboris]|uniref:Glycosyl-hydrolase family 116 catalytic region domain-containing protein n=1 Tax=Adhaeribacter arboris TaxID=2072846 RepID=A0A2T2YAU1_9BACT|nr:GH116 family glycosyl-hydrolase [Adhaeribacter arboris]PSR52635.1 hypothetical protein AHMF7605_03390 [Adhaeribacter arboris]
MQIRKINRRDFLKQSSVLSASFLTSGLPVIAGPFPPGALADGQIPVDKKLDPAWIKSLYQRGQVTTYLKTKNELNYIGMPVGGITCGTLYLGGDGRLWLWDIFNKNQEGIEPKELQWDIGVLDKSNVVKSRDGACYVQPAQNIRPLEQGFALQIKYENTTVIKQLKTEDWPEIKFEATYPFATIHYLDAGLPVLVQVEVYSPFIPLDAENSGLPAAIYSFQIINTSRKLVEVTIMGWLENKAGIYSGEQTIHQRYNTAYQQPGLSCVTGSIRAKGSALEELKLKPDYGSMTIASLNKNTGFVGTDITWPLADAVFTQPSNNTEAIKDIKEKLIGGVGHNFSMKPGKAVRADYVISWFFPNLQLKEVPDKKRYYANKFNSSLEVATYLQQNFKKLSSLSKLWKQTWYEEATLPHWFLERTFANTSTLATTTCHRFGSGRFYAWEGVGCCPGTCTHVWQYAQAVGRLFPLLERETREQIDLGLSLSENGAIWFRGEADHRPAVDGQAGTILRIYREHQMSTDSSFLNQNWSKIKRAITFLLTLDKNKDGLEDTPLENTLDAVWDGEIAWIVGLCLAAVKAGQAMAEEMHDADFAAVCQEYVTKGSRNMEDKLFNGEYFIHRPDPEKGRAHLGSYNTSHIDQVYGQSWAFQVGLGRIINQQKTLSALKSLWKYNYTPDVGPYIKEHTGGRPYALAGEGGLVMNTNPKQEAKPYGDNQTWQLGYFHECMSGFEHQVAAHMMAEGMIEEALVITRTIHDRYHARKRNPFNEIECSDHYARAMASYGTFITACGFENHGPKGYIAFAPKINPERFKAAFTSANGWGSYSQQINPHQQVHQIQLKYGDLQVEKIKLEIQDKQPIQKVIAKLGKQILPVQYTQTDNSILIQFNKRQPLLTNQTLSITLRF